MTLAIGFDVPFEEAIAAAVARGVVLPDDYYGKLQGVARQLAFSISVKAAMDQLQLVSNSLSKSMTEGIGFNEWKKTAAAQNLGLPNHRLDNIWRTNLQGNYMRGKWQQFVDNTDTHPYLMYDAINDTRVRPSHLAMDGTIRRWDDPWLKTHSPPCGFRCRCSLIALTEKEAKLRSGPGKGLNKIPVNKDGTPAQPDKGWDYNPFDDRLQEIRQIDLSRFSPKLMAAGDKILDRTTNSIQSVKGTTQTNLDARAQVMLNALIRRAEDAKGSTETELLKMLWTNRKRYHDHVDKRRKDGQIENETDYAKKTFSVIASADRMTLVIGKNDYASGKLQVMTNGWIVLIGNDGHIVTSHPFDPNKQTFEMRHMQSGDTIYEHVITAETRRLLAVLFTRH